MDGRPLGARILCLLENFCWQRPVTNRVLALDILRMNDFNVMTGVAAGRRNRTVLYK